MENEKVVTITEEEVVANIANEVSKEKLKKYMKRGVLVLGGIGVAALVYTVIKNQPEEVIEIVEKIAD